MQTQPNVVHWAAIESTRLLRDRRQPSVRQQQYAMAALERITTYPRSYNADAETLLVMLASLSLRRLLSPELDVTLRLTLGKLRERPAAQALVSSCVATLR